MLAPTATNISPNCLRVERATIFFMSVSVKAETLAINMVIMPITSKNSLKEIIGLKRITRYTPAVTKVEECTKADTGVGAAIAAGNHAEKGIWALLVIPATIKIKEETSITSKFDRLFVQNSHLKFILK